MIAELAIHEECEAPVNIGVVAVRRIFALQQVDRSARFTGGNRQVGHADVEPVVVLELEVAQIELAGALLVDDRDFNRVRPLGQDFLGHEAAVFGNGDRPAGHPDFMSFGHIVAVYADRAAAQSNVVQAKAVLAVSGQQVWFVLNLYGVIWRRIARNDP